LENELEVKLFDRLGKKVKLTVEGKILFNITDKFLTDLENLKKIYSDIRHGDVGNLTITASSAVVTYLLPDIIRNFVNQFPRINLKLIICSFVSEIMTLILNGEIAFGIGIKSDQLLPEKIDFVFWKSFETYLILCKGHPLSHKRTIGLNDIAIYPHILYNKGSILRKIVEEAYARNKTDIKIVMEVDVAENLKTYVEMGIGVGILSSLTIVEHDRKRLAIINVSDLFDKVDVGIYYGKDKHITMAMKQFIKLLAPELSDRFVSC
jgi:DNA-binding transcriptional LysR family regulator